MTEHLQGKPFQLIGINSDTDRSVFMNGIKKRGITWRQAWEGQCPGKISLDWNGACRGLPMTFVIDAKGILRYRDLHGDELEQAAVKLLAEH